MFQQRHYCAIAATIRKAQIVRPTTGARTTYWQELITDLSDMFAADNPKFKADLFKRACEPVNSEA